MTDDKIALRELLEKGSDATFLREMIGFAAQRLMELESESLCGAGHGERSDARRNHRNGYRDRDRETRAGLRPGHFHPLGGRSGEGAWAWRASARARSRGSAARSTSASKPSR